jgi:protein dithiol oxidoreductase (disulfide-forming)
MMTTTNDRDAMNDSIMTNRRHFTLTAGASLLVVSGAAQAQAAAAVEGRDFVRLAAPAPVPAGGKIDVVEFFSYACPHCYEFEPVLDQWVKRLPPDVVFRRVPAAFNAVWESYARAYYAFEASGLLETLHKRLFAALHVQRLRLNDEKDMADWVGKNGGDAAKFAEALKSFGTATKVRQGKQLAEAYKIDGVPTLGIHGRFFTSGALAGSHGRALQVAEQLVQRARKPA